ncbi:single-stranded DNA-binding protein [Williamsia sterculiae]|uniref:Single-strand DNA-binding protein n=1 Tax=Williamsia sterculiae TaxID=1344003 RepID=A0A1N7GKL2_9NOCA|nr:single-stranded DNA-binding protein [Williamsia sterculiae]SIS13038.1 single-strand DNA-binding protein [Williamsia sterculiae]
MYETYTTVIGTVVSEPRRRRTQAGEEVISFRMACNSRRQDRQSGEWNDGPTLYLTVSCWRRLLAGVSGVVQKGRPVIAHGQIKTNEYTTGEGERRADLEMTASAVGLDLSRCTVGDAGSRQVVDVVAEQEPTEEVTGTRGDTVAAGPGEKAA